MAISEAEVRNIAHLARIKVSDEDVVEFRKNLTNILELVNQLNAVDTQNIQPMAHPLEISQRVRPDVISEQINRERLQQLALSTEAGYYLVPQVIE
jgi:aspartyl-tRNA(Asn)/glutamyl-tRNA(Gln) amidotransferase subunit C